MPGLRILLPCALLALVPAVADGNNCKCRNRGVHFELGETSCLRVDGTSYLARCEMKLNVSSWTRIGEGCPEAGAKDSACRAGGAGCAG